MILKHHVKIDGDVSFLSVSTKLNFTESYRFGVGDYAGNRITEIWFQDTFMG